jgi:hypothetical protein
MANYIPSIILITKVSPLHVSSAHSGVALPNLRTTLDNLLLGVLNVESTDPHDFQRPTNLEEENPKHAFVCNITHMLFVKGTA